MNSSNRAFHGKTFLVTGGLTGFLGANFVRRLIDAGAEVVAHSRTAGQRPVCDVFPSDLKTWSQDLAESYDFPEGIDVVVHCAAHTSGALEMVHDPLAQLTRNSIINSRLFENCLRAGVKTIIYISSSAVYPDKDAPLTETDGFVSDPPDVYFGPAWMKRYAEKLGEYFSVAHGMNVLVIRPSNIYGPYCSFDPDRAHVLPALIRKFVAGESPVEIWGTPDVVRDFIYVDDFIDGVFSGLEKTSGFNVFNIASGSTCTIGAAAVAIAKAAGYDREVVFNSDKPVTAHTRRIDVTKAKSELAFKIKTNFEDGLSKVVEQYRKGLEDGSI
ncbi:MAG: NAD-dependent epimerase/dehydratase family protein [Rhodospirillales bacterium]|nr:NAD-dependent epimerase/dehydratase family protein [Rhodospirillales bacterium]